MKIKKILIEDLFDTFTHRIDFNQNNSITLILGRNGLGKTVVLKIIKSIFEGDFFQIEKIDFSKISIHFEDNTTWQFERKKGENSNKTIILTSHKGEEKIHSMDFAAVNENLEKVARTINQYIPGPIRRMDSDEWYDRRSEIRYTTKELINKYRDHLPPENLKEIFLVPDWYSEKIKNLKVALIETQRLLTLSKDNDEFRYRGRDRDHNIYKNTVEEYSEHLVDEIHNQLAKSSELSTKLDRTYPNRLINRLKNLKQKISQEDLNESLKNLEYKREKLHEVGLLDLQNQPHIDIIDEEQDDKIRAVFQVYIEDSQQKLEVYDDLADRIELFLKIVNERFLKKKLSISKQEGFHFESTKNGKLIPLKNLSSGEQHILVLYYELLFKLKKGTLLLMDEPEISLHIAWQKKIINDLQEILKLNPMEVIIATHSPAVIGNNWDLTVELKEE
ncbi:Predicted ATP-binding protein involved in virulence [Salegentibacter holothuriorum]|uniref:Predicted ATP-binding protein involved in virulence n=1 Tax=Salegentibacter holothuriorum TaxID=241145 RepID=A0A1T5DZ58_9FLAO|nr:AAA family ATPase [Salegentibacter holothuriorum]SKB76914.1 Predicted ATP-binding protein involved in virulence [Salegentibacter holothuriorum]